jgi:hypothetical protein
MLELWREVRFVPIPEVTVPPVLIEKVNAK